MSRPRVEPVKKQLQDASPVDPIRVKAFALFFKRYMSISTLVVASLPIPVTAFQLIPTFRAQTRFLSVYTPLFCFLILGFIFYSRHQLARVMFPGFFPQGWFIEASIGRRKLFSSLDGLPRAVISVLPLLFIIASIVLVFLYHDVLNLSVRSMIGPTAVRSGSDFQAVLESTSLDQISYSSRLMILYLGIFVTAEAAFIMMAIKEYLQDLVGLSEMELIVGMRFSEIEAPIVTAELDDAIRAAELGDPIRPDSDDKRVKLGDEP